MKFVSISAILFFVFTTSLKSQIPESSIFLLTIKNVRDTIWHFSKVEYLNSFNPKGYNNQVYFLSPSELLASVRLTDQDNNDIYKFNLNTKTYTNLTQSRASEYSPRASPDDPNIMTCVRVPYGDTSIQDLVLINLNTGVDHGAIFSSFSKIGYYRHFKEKQWICYLVEATHLLGICDAGLLKTKIFASSIGRSFEIINHNDVLFVHKITNEKWLLKMYNTETEKSKLLAEMPQGTEDFTVDEFGTIFCASDSKILRLAASGNWTTLIDLKPLNIKNINRIAISKNKMAVVSNSKS